MTKTRKLGNRYQFQPWYVRLYRRAKYQPVAIFAFFVWLGWWASKACPVAYTELEDSTYYYESRWSTIKLAWIVLAKSWTIPAQYYFTLEEAVQSLQSTGDSWFPTNQDRPY